MPSCELSSYFNRTSSARLFGDGCDEIHVCRATGHRDKMSREGHRCRETQQLGHRCREKRFKYSGTPSRSHSERSVEWTRDRGGRGLAASPHPLWHGGAQKVFQGVPPLPDGHPRGACIPRDRFALRRVGARRALLARACRHAGAPSSHSLPSNCLAGGFDDTASITRHR